MRRIFALFSVFLAVNVYGASNLQSKRYFINNGGLLDRNSPLAVPDQFASSINNATLDTRGQLLKRNGQSLVNSSTGILTTSAVTGGGYHASATGINFFGVVVGTNVYREANTFAGSFTNVTSTVTITAGASNLVQVTDLNDKLIFCNESDKPFYLDSTNNAVQISTPLFTAAKTCATYGAYLIIGNTTETSVNYGSRIRWSDINTPNSFPALNYIDVEPDDGDRIVSVISFDDSVYIFKKRSVYRMVITGLDGPDAFIIRPVLRNVGAWAKNSVRVVPGQGIFFLAQNTLYQLSNSQAASLNGGGLEPIGDPIQRTFDSINRAQWGNAVAAVYPKKYQYWISVATNSATSNNTVLVYDYIQKAWTIYSNINANALAQAEDSNGNNLLISGDYAGNQYKQDTTNTTDNVNGVTTAIPFAYTTPDLVLDSPEFTKNFKYLYLFFNVVESTTTVEAAFDYSSSYEYSTNISLGQIGALYDTAIYNTDVFPSVNYKVARIEINRSAKAIKLRFSESSANSYGVIGWALVYSLEDWKQ